MKGGGRGFEKEHGEVLWKGLEGGKGWGDDAIIISKIFLKGKKRIDILLLSMEVTDTVPVSRTSPVGA